MKYTLTLCIALLLAACFSTTSFAQVPGNPTDVIANGTSYKIFARPGEATVQILVLGDAPVGVYVVGASTTLTKLIALTGAAPGNSQEIKSVTLRLLRENGAQRSVVFETELDELLQNPGSQPPLREGDIVDVDVEYKSTLGFREVLSIVSSLTSLALLIIRVAAG